MEVVANSKISGACGPGMRLAFFHAFTRLLNLHCNKFGVVWTMQVSLLQVSLLQVSLLQDLADT
jgi:hypothetical protein